MQWEKIKTILSQMENPVEKLEIVMDLGKGLKEIPKDCESYEIKGCASLVKICNKDSQFYGFADSSLVRGLVFIVLSIVEGKSIQEIKEMDILGEFESLNLSLGAGRVNGINSMISFLKNL